ncbi:MAG: hypothetical protein ABEJ93_00770 [Candidatus Nanohalobium sp.]
MNWHPSYREEVTDDFVRRRAGVLQHLVHRYAALNPEIDYGRPTAEEYSEGWQTPLEEYPENVRSIAETLGFHEEDFDSFNLRNLVRKLHHNISDEAGRLMVLREDIDLDDETEDLIDEAFYDILSLEEPSGRRRSPEEGVPANWNEKGEEIYEFLGGDIPIREQEGEFMPLNAEVGRRYEQIRDLPDDREAMTNQEIQSVTSGISNLKNFFNA